MTDKYEGHLTGSDDGEQQTWGWSNWMLKNANMEQMKATAELLRDAPKLLDEVKRLRKENKMLKTQGGV